MKKSSVRQVMMLIVAVVALSGSRVAPVSALSYVSGPLGLTIGPNAGTVTRHTLTVADRFLIQDLSVSLDLQHTMFGNLLMTVAGPNGDVITLTEAGPGNDNFVAGEIYTWRDSAAAPLSELPGNSDIPGGAFLPSGGTFAGLYGGLDVQGDWTLTITDLVNGHRGTLLNWTLDVEPANNIDTVPEPGMMLLFGTGLVGILAYRRRRQLTLMMVNWCAREGEGKDSVGVGNGRGRKD